MKVNVNCYTCLNSGNNSKFIILHETGKLARFTCPEGHLNECAITNAPFDLLFSQACYSLIDYNVREAVGNYISSLERFYEHIIKIDLLANKVPYSEIQDYWKGLKGSSERQFGAFQSSYFNIFKRPFFSDIASIFGAKSGKSFYENKMKLRNDVVHNGHFISLEAASKFGEFVWKVIKSVQNQYNEKYKDVFEDYFQIQSETLNTHDQEIYNPEWKTRNHVLSYVESNADYKSFDALLKVAKQMKVIKFGN